MSYLSEASKIFTLIFNDKTQEVIDALEKGVIEIDHHYQFSSGDTPLVWAVIKNNIVLAKYLLEKGANVNFVQAKYKTTPLHIAVRRGLDDMCKLLLAHGADALAREKHGQTPGQWLTSSRCRAVHVLSKEVLDKLPGYKADGGVYKEPEPDLAFWGKYGPPKKLTPEEEAKQKAEEKALLKSLKKKAAPNKATGSKKLP